MPTTAQAIIELDFQDSSEKEEVQLPEQLIKDYQDLNEKLEETIVKIQKRKHSPRKAKSNLKK
jgi:hypothetical protein